MSTIPALFSAAKAKSGPSTSARDVESNSSSESDHDIGPPIKRKCTESDKGMKYRSKASKRKYSKSWEKEFRWLMYDEDSDGAFCRTCKESGRSLQRTGGVWVTKPFQNWKKAVEKMRAHERSESHIQASEALLLAAKTGMITQQLQSIVLESRKGQKIGLQSNLRFVALIFSLVNTLLTLLISLS